MNRILFAMLALAGALLPLLLDSALKGVALLAVAALGACALGRASAATRHLVWLAALACALALPLCSWLLPGWRVLPAWMRWEEISRRPIVLPTAAPAPAPALVPGPSLESVAAAPTRPDPGEIEPPVTAIFPPASAPAATPRTFRISATALFAMWAAGAALLLGRLAWSALALARVARRADAVRGGRIAALAVAIAGELGLRLRVPVLLGDAAAMPMVWGVFRPRLLIPAAAADWPEARLRGVLLHELAHLRRGDPLALLVAQLALALHWFNPLAWFAVRRLRAEQERACDDFVLRHGIRASEYATDLLAVATGLRAEPCAATALTMAHPARIEGRIASILDAARNRASVTRWIVFATVLLAAVIAVPLAMVRAAEEKGAPAGNHAPEASKTAGESVVVSTVVSVVTTADSAEISVNEKRGSLAFVTGEGAEARVIVHDFGGGAGAIAFRVSADDRQGKWWDQARVVREGESEAWFPELPDDWLPRGRVVFLPSPVKRADGAVVFAEIESASGKSILAVRTASQGEIGDANYRQIPRTCPETEINLDCRIYALGANAPAKAVILPVLAAQDLTGPPRGALSFPYLTLKPGVSGTYDRMAGRAETVEATATMAGGSVAVAGSVVLRLVEGKYTSAAEAFRQSEESSRKDSTTIPGNQLRAQFSATLGSNDALVVPIASEGTFPETLVASMTALPRRLSRVRWIPPEARAPIELDGWVLTWPRAEREWFASNFDYKGVPEMIAHQLAQRKDTTVNWTTSEAVGTLKQEEVEKLLAGFRQRSGVTAERVERFSAKQNISGFPADEDRTHFKAAGEGVSVLPGTDGRYIHLYLKWDAPVLRQMSASDPYLLNSGTSICVLLPGPADPEKIRLLVLRCVDPGMEPRPKSAALLPQERGQAVQPAHESAPAPVKARAALPDDAYTKAGVPVDEFDAGGMSWGAEQHGLYVGIRVPAGGAWRIGGEVKVELWACNPGGEDVKFSQNPRADVGLSVFAKDKDGKNHFADITRFSAYPVFNHLLLPPGHVVKLKEFVVKLGAKKNENLEWGWVNLELTPGDYQLRAKWSDAHPMVAAGGEWTGEIESGAIEVKLVAAGPAEKPGIEPRPKSAAIQPQERGQAAQPAHESAQAPVKARAALPDDAYTKAGVPVGEFDAGSMKWGGEQNGLYVGIRVAANAEWRIGGEVKMELWACNPSGQEVKFSRNSRADIGLSVIAQDKDGKNHFADIARFDAYPVYDHLLLPPGHVVKLKEFVVKLRAMKNEKPDWGWVYLELTPGDYQIRAKWSDPHPQIANQGEWTGEIESGAIKVKLVTAGAAEKPGANVTDPAYGTGPVTPLMYRAAAGDLASVQKLIDAGEDVNARTGDENAGGAVVGGITPLLIACRDGHFDVAQALLAAGATVVKAKSANGRFPLFDALAGAKDEAAAVQLMALLLDHGADPNERELHAGSTLHMAVLRDWKSAVRLLVARGANPTAEVRGFKTPAELAREKGLKEMAALLDELARAPAAKPENPKAPDERAKVDIGRDGAISLNGGIVTLEQLKAEVAKHPKQTVEVHAPQDVPYAKVVEVVDALKAAGVTDFFFRAAQVGDGKFRVANRTGEYDLGDGRKLYLCRPREQRQWFTVIWPAAGPWPRSRLSTYPNVSDQARDQWAVVWEPGAEVLWWADGSDVGKMRVTNPTEVIVTREGRENNFARDFGLPDEVKEEFRRIGMVIGRDKTPGREMLIGGNTGGQSILSAETQDEWSVEGTVTDAAERPIAGVAVRARTEYEPTVEIANATTDAQGRYRIAFRLKFDTLRKFRGVAVEPVREGFIDRDLAKPGEFNALLYPGEKPRRPGDEHAPYIGPETFAPGEIRRFAERDLVPEVAGRADFALLPAGEISGEIVDDKGRPLSGCGIAVSVPGQRPFDSVAMTGADEQGRFRMKGIPFHLPLSFMLSPSGRIDEQSKTAPEKFAPGEARQIRIVIPHGDNGYGPPRLERAAPGAKVHPERTHLFNDRYAAIAVQTGDQVNFVLVHSGFLSSAMQDWWSGTSGSWSFEGDVHLVDVERTRVAGQNVDKRKIAVKYTSAAPDTLFLDGKAYDLAHSPAGRIFILRENGEPVQTDRTLPLRDAKDLETIGRFAERDLRMFETYAESRRVQAMGGWVLAWDMQDSIRRGDGQHTARLRIFPDGRMLSLPDGRELPELKIAPGEIAELLRWLVEERKVPEWKERTVEAGRPDVDSGARVVKNIWDRKTDIVQFRYEGKLHGFAVEQGDPDGAVFDPIRERLLVMLKEAEAQTGAR